ncbi:NAD(P)-binding protein [Hypoxylon fragiforme]|uniref:NAD(P)-binding protein n=1 Tax=Hypoxylon fragiforme TaxID=63214 RepID=UPI0020C6A1DF|nr:NAD(P)-binding protein [Hypoxylon fragiforme]KAI2611646.1 NAD(P)-binding protein [Hypoxylon fragiforme]
MKLIVTGSTGYVGREVIRQSLCKSEITSVVALSRQPVPVPDGLPEGADTSKLRSVIIEDYGRYSDEVKREFAGADAFAITPSKSKMYDPEEVKRICQTSTLAGLSAMHESGLSNPFRFIYMSGAGVGWDESKVPRYMLEYLRMRGETEKKVKELATELGGIEVTAPRPGLITTPGEIWRCIAAFITKWLFGVIPISIEDLTRVMLDQAINGIEKDALMPEDLARIAEGIPKS